LEWLCLGVAGTIVSRCWSFAFLEVRIQFRGAFRVYGKRWISKTDVCFSVRLNRYGIGVSSVLRIYFGQSFRISSLEWLCLGVAGTIVSRFSSSLVLRSWKFAFNSVERLGLIGSGDYWELIFAFRFDWSRWIWCVACAKNEFLRFEILERIFCVYLVGDRARICLSLSYCCLYIGNNFRWRPESSLVSNLFPADRPYVWQLVVCCIPTSKV